MNKKHGEYRDYHWRGDRKRGCFSLAAIILQNISAGTAQQQWKKKGSGITAPSRRTKRLTPNTRATAPNFLTGSQRTHKKRRKPSRTSPTLTTPSNFTTRRILTREWHFPKSPSSLISISQASNKKMENYCLWVQARSPWPTQLSVSFELFFLSCKWTANWQRSTTALVITGRE